MGKIAYPFNSIIAEEVAAESPMKKQRVGEPQSSAALMLLLLRDGLATDPVLNEKCSVQALPPIDKKQKEEGIHVSVTDDEDETRPRSSIASKRLRPATNLSSAKRVLKNPLPMMGKEPTLYQPPRLLPEGRPLAAPPTLRMPRGFKPPQLASKKL